MVGEKKKVEVNGTLNTAYLSMHVVPDHPITDLLCPCGLPMDISEHPLPHRSRSWCFYFVFFAAVVPLWSSIPLAWAFAIFSLADHKWASYTTLGRSLFFVSCCEVSAPRLRISCCLFFIGHLQYISLLPRAPCRWSARIWTRRS